MKERERRGGECILREGERKGAERTLTGKGGLKRGGDMK